MEFRSVLEIGARVPRHDQHLIRLPLDVGGLRRLYAGQSRLVEPDPRVGRAGLFEDRRDAARRDRDARRLEYTRREDRTGSGPERAVRRTICRAAASTAYTSFPCAARSVGRVPGSTDLSN